MSSQMSHIAPQTVAWEPKLGLVAVRSVDAQRIDGPHTGISQPVGALARSHNDAKLGATVLRERFFPEQLRRSVMSSLQAIAAGRKQRLTWSGWDRSLPRLYLPAQQLQRLLTESVDGITRSVEQTGADQACLNVRVELPRIANATLVIALEANRWSCDSKFRGALNARWFRHGSQSHLWQRLARQCDSVGGWLSVADLAGGGAALLINLPIDQPRALVYSWLCRQLPAAGAAVSSNSQVSSQLPLSLYVVGRSQSETMDELSAANVRLQSLARSEDYIYRAGHARWIWLSMASDLPAFVRTASWQSQLLDEWYCSTEHSAIIDLAQQVDRRFRELIGTRVPPLDMRTHKLSRGPITTQRPNTRIDSPSQSSRPNHLHTRTKWRYPI